MSDGTSQAERLQTALDPAYVSVDERSPTDLLGFAKEFARELKYFDDQNQERGDWSGFFEPGPDPETMADFMANPEKYDPQTKPGLFLFRPHFVLFLTFIKLLDHARGHLNTLTRRHLEFYYRKVLGLHKKAAVPDKVNVLIEPAKNVKPFLLTAGTLLDAGPDSRGGSRVYHTDRDIIVSQAKVGQLSSVHVHKKITGIREAHRLHEGPENEKFMRMLEISLGDPDPGDSLPAYEKGRRVDMALLHSLAALLNFTGTDLYMEFFELHELMRLKRRRDQADDEWAAINKLLETAGRQRTGNPQFQLSLADPRDFNANLAEALGGAPNFDGITEVENIYDLYDQSNRSEVQEFIRTQLHFEDIENFYKMVRIKIPIDNEWNEINLRLVRAGRKKNPDFRFPPDDAPDFDSTDFEANLKSALAPDFTKLSDVANLEQYHDAVQQVERYMFMSAGKFAYLMKTRDNPAATEREWGNVYDILAAAHREKIYTRRRRELREERENKGFAAMVRVVLGEALDRAETLRLEQLKDYKISEDDFKFLLAVEKESETGKVTAEEWDEVYRILEIVQRVRENLPEPVAQKEDWLNLYPYADATAVEVENGSGAESQHPRWKTFGQPILDTGPDSPPPPTFGWAISSPQLALSQGERTVTLTLGFDAGRFDEDKIDPFIPQQAVTLQANQGPFSLELSTAKGWAQPAPIRVERGLYTQLTDDSGPDAEKQKLRAIKISFTISPETDAIAPLPAQAAFADSPWPILRLMLRQVWDTANRQYVVHYLPFKDLQLVCIHLKVHVTGLTEVVIRNDETVLDANKPFEPFTTRPAAGSRFYLGHPELFNKQLDSLRFDFEWMGVPADLKDHYANYDFNGTSPNFTALISLVDKQVDITLDDKAPLVKNPATATESQQIDITDFQSALAAGGSGFSYARYPDAATAEDLLRWKRYLRWELNSPDFQHDYYPTLAAAKSVELAAQIAKDRTKVTAAKYKVSPPYTPKMKGLSISYASSLEVVLAQYERGAGTDRIFHLHPFGYNEVLLQTNERGCRFLPQYDNEGELYIGLKDVQSPQQLSILFQLAEGSSDPDLTPASILWSCLDDNRWRSLKEGNIRLDTTRGLINSGIIEFDLPSVRPSTRMTANFYWIRGAVAKHSSSVCDTVAVHPQAVSATFEDNDNAPDHYRNPLPAGTITGPVKPTPQIAGIHQPYTSYGGKSEEQDRNFYTRISERLRHKQRALTSWDYERLVLERFPQIYRVKCLPAGAAGRSVEPGRVEIIIIPDIRNQLPFDPFEPKVSADVIADIESYLMDRIPAWATLIVRNARYLAVKMRIGVRFKAGSDVGYFKPVLNDELNRFLSPWAYREGADITIGGKIYANSIVNFVDRREYVDYVAGIKFFISRDGHTFELVQPSEAEGYFVGTDEPDAVLVAARQHEFDIISDVEYDHEKFTGINYMKIELDFIVAEKP
jgi:hypothetical protein